MIKKVQRMKPILASVIACGLLTACTNYGSPPDDTPAPPPKCEADPAQRFIGQQATEGTGAQIKAATGATIFQWVPEGSAVTMDYRVERVRVVYNSSNTITQITCG